MPHPSKKRPIVQVVRAVLAEPGHATDEINASLGRFQTLVDQTAKLASP
jgi:hypothetical protein